MRILDINNNELREEDINLEFGFLKQDKILIEHHEEQKEQERNFHYKVATFYFEDGTKLKIEDEDDPRVGKDDIYRGLFHYISLNEEEPKRIRGLDLQEVEDNPYIPHREAWDEYEHIQRYIPYTEDELARRAAEKETERKQEDFLKNGYDQLVNLKETTATINETIDDLVLVMADLFGSEEKEVEE